ncbi:Putative ribonuclease H protein At1g65750 [Linum grandiflorum]
MESLDSEIGNLPDDYITAGPPSLVWPLETSGIFSVRSLRHALTRERFHGYNFFPHDTIWVKSAPTKVQCFLWRVFHKKVASLDNLQRRGYHMANRCPMCQKTIETVDHLFLRCAFSRTIWDIICSKLLIHGPMLSDTSEFIAAWKGMNCKSPFQAVMEVLMHATIWFLWLERNERIFNDKISSSAILTTRILVNVGRWVEASGLLPKSKVLMWNQIVFDPG